MAKNKEGGSRNTVPEIFRVLKGLSTSGKDLLCTLVIFQQEDCIISFMK